jgi:hypothetical protein
MTHRAYLLLPSLVVLTLLPSFSSINFTLQRFSYVCEILKKYNLSITVWHYMLLFGCNPSKKSASGRSLLPISMPFHYVTREMKSQILVLFH